jgi:hypothetical protein
VSQYLLHLGACLLSSTSDSAIPYVRPTLATISSTLGRSGVLCGIWGQVFTFAVARRSRKIPRSTGRGSGRTKLCLSSFSIFVPEYAFSGLSDSRQRLRSNRSSRSIAALRSSRKRLTAVPSLPSTRSGFKLQDQTRSNRSTASLSSSRPNRQPLTVQGSTVPAKMRTVLAVQRRSPL